MDPISHLNPIERNICNKADLAQIPVAGNIELLPLCNMDCKMCFAKMTRQEMEAHSPMHTHEEWLRIAEQAAKSGTIFMLLTGGEPFLYPNLKELYQGLKRLGMIVSINTNGTLITDEIADWLAQDPPRRLNITLYGANDATYGKLCGNPHGFSQVMDAVKRLTSRKISIKFNCSLTPDNIGEMDAIWAVSQKWNIPIEMGFYMFPPVRKNNVGNEKNRLRAEDAAWARFHMEELRYGKQFGEYVRYTLQRFREYHQTEPYQEGYTCRSGNSVFWINYDGTLSACSFTNDFQVNVFEQGFLPAWEAVKEHVGCSKMAQECHMCEKRLLCGRCAAAAISETGIIGGVPRYYCELTERYLELLKEREETEGEKKSEFYSENNSR